MKNTRFYIKNMVCEHCAEVLYAKLTTAGFDIHHIELGELQLKHLLNEEEYQRLGLSCIKMTTDLPPP